MLAATIAIGLAMPAPAQEQLVAEGSVTVGSRRVSRTVTEFALRLRVRNTSDQAIGPVRAQVVSTASETTIIEGVANFDAIQAQGTAQSLDTYIIRHNRSVPFNPASLRFTFTVRIPKANGTILFSDLFAGSLMTVDADGGIPAAIPNTDGLRTIPPLTVNWSPDGRWIVFSDGRIHVIGVDGAGLTQLGGAVGWEPSWSPDGTQIVWQRECDIWLMNADGTGQRNLTQTGNRCSPLTAQEFHPKWSPDGTRISFETYRTGDLEIFTMDPDGGGATNLTNRSGADYEADWSPDGARIVFRSDRDGGADGARGEIYVMDANGLNQTNLSRTPSVREGAPVWSPDGTQIAFLSARYGGNEIFMMNADGTNLRLVLKTFATSSIDWKPSVAAATRTATAFDAKVSALR